MGTWYLKEYFFFSSKYLEGFLWLGTLQARRPGVKGARGRQSHAIATRFLTRGQASQANQTCMAIHLPCTGNSLASLLPRQSRPRDNQSRPRKLCLQPASSLANKLCLSSGVSPLQPHTHTQSVVVVGGGGGRIKNPGAFHRPPSASH